MTVSDVEKLYQRVMASSFKPFRELTTRHYRNSEKDIIQQEFLIQAPDGYLLRFTE